MFAAVSQLKSIIFTCPSLCNEPPPSRMAFSDVPPDIMIEILKELDWMSLLSLRQTCQGFHEISRLPILWHNQYHQYTASHKSLPSRIEEPLESYSSAELEQWVLVRRSADHTWHNHSATPTRIRTIKCKAIVGHIQEMSVVPGGRWLLVGDTQGSIVYYDLNAPEISERILISTQDPRYQHVQNFQILIDEQEPRLSFILAFSETSGMYGAGCELFNPAHLQFWQVTLIGHGVNAQLMAQRITTIPYHDNQLTVCLGMYGNIVARSVSAPLRDYHVEIYNWRNSTDLISRRAVVFVRECVLHVSVLPGNRLLVFTSTRLKTFKIPEFEKKVPGGWVSTMNKFTPPLHDLPFRMRQLGISKPLIDDRKTSFVVCSQDIVYIVEISHITGCPWFTQVAQLKPNCVLSTGMEKIFVQHRDSARTISVDLAPQTIHEDRTEDYGVPYKADSYPANTRRRIWPGSTKYRDGNCGGGYSPLFSNV